MTHILLLCPYCLGLEVGLGEDPFNLDPQASDRASTVTVVDSYTFEVLLNLKVQLPLLSFPDSLYKTACSHPSYFSSHVSGPIMLQLLL